MDAPGNPTVKVVNLGQSGYLRKFGFRSRVIVPIEAPKSLAMFFFTSIVSGDTNLVVHHIDRWTGDLPPDSVRESLARHSVGERVVVFAPDERRAHVARRYLIDVIGTLASRIDEKIYHSPHESDHWTLESGSWTLEVSQGSNRIEEIWHPVFPGDWEPPPATRVNTGLAITEGEQLNKAASNSRNRDRSYRRPNFNKESRKSERLSQQRERSASPSKQRTKRRRQ